jgi:hypothetical protein
MDQSKEFLKKCVKFFWQNKDLPPYYLKVIINNTDGNPLYINKNYKIYYDGQIIPLNNLQELNTFIDENIPVIDKIYLAFKYSIFNGGKSYIDSNGNTQVINYKLYDQGEYFFGCDIQNIRLKFKLLSRIYRLFAAIYVQEDTLKTLSKIVRLKNDNVRIENEIKKRQDKIKNFDQSKLNDRIVNLIEFAKLNQKPPKPPKLPKQSPPPRSPSTRRSPGKEEGFFRGMAFGNIPLTLDDLRIQLTEITNDPFKHTCGIQELRLNRELSKFRDTCNNILIDIKNKIKIITDELGLEGMNSNKINKKLLEKARVKTQNYINKHQELNLKNINLYDTYKHNKRFVRNTGDLIKVSTSFTNQRFNYLDKDRAEQKLLSNGFGKRKSKYSNVKSLKMDLKKLLKGKIR